MRRWALLAVLLAVAAVAQGQATTEEAPTVAVVRVVARPVLIRPAEVLGRKFGPFGSDDAEDSPHAAMWRAVEDQLSQIATLHDRVTAAMTIRCPRLRQRALELALASAISSTTVEAQEEPQSDDMGTWATVIDLDAEDPSYARTAVTQSLLDGDNELPEWMDQEMMGKIDDDDDDDDDPPRWAHGMMMPHGHSHDKMFHHDRMHERMHEWMHGHGHEHPEHPEHPDGPFPLPLPFHHHSEHEHGHEHGPFRHHHTGGMPMDRLMARLEDMHRHMMPMDAGRSEPWRGMGPASVAVPEDDATNWALWNEDGSLNGGLILFAMLCAACAAVWSALLLQCAAFGWDRACAAGRGQFAYSAVPWAFETSSDEEDEDDPKAALKREQARVVYAADFVGKA